ncbi:alkylation response protein AidB-like acyl-CoA dehydrogenase [Fluviicoccus keumensis]|uniref:Alkylation response protein AidB-like acyl-CoA dehydrogenase n=1 Tax=Fluviicoccus keumensis TaxID=1435465 RepID=A0A4Q7YJK4_9GAMM|nr:acyl-CoA dehydrogenase family protein [Fluviicoccus keumensis]RZU36801.1 alkylation response protein AidB-like acyl-CoA dehydrogenase [Fluviicoccus keumensis]
MNFDLDESHRIIRATAQRFARNVIAPRAYELATSAEVPYDLIAKMGELGFMGIPFAPEYGGGGGDWVSLHLVIEAISRADMGLGTLIDVTTSVVTQEIDRFGTEAQKQKWLPDLCAGKTIGAFALTEPHSGSDAGALKTRAVFEDGEWVLNGRKQFITNVALDNCPLVVVAARAEIEGQDRIVTFIAPKSSPGFIVGRSYHKIAFASGATNELVFENCRLGADSLLGDPRRGFAQHLSVLETGRISIAAACVGGAQACLDHALAYARERVQFGKPIFEFQATQFKLSDMAVKIEMARTLYLKAAWLKDQGRPHTFEAASAKLYASEILEQCASEAVQIFGGNGLMEDYPVAGIYRASKIMQIVEGTSEVQRLIIGRLLAAGKES